MRQILRIWINFHFLLHKEKTVQVAEYLELQSLSQIHLHFKKKKKELSQAKLIWWVQVERESSVADSKVRKKQQQKKSNMPVWKP